MLIVCTSIGFSSSRSFVLKPVSLPLQSLSAKSLSYSQSWVIQSVAVVHPSPAADPQSASQCYPILSDFGWFIIVVWRRRILRNPHHLKFVIMMKSSTLHQFYSTLVYILFIVNILISRNHVTEALHLKPPTPEKEVFTGDSFVITCLSDEPSTPDVRLQWLNPDGREVPSIPTAPVYVSEKPDGLQIVFLRHNKKHTGRYLCVQTNVQSGEKLSEIPFSVKIYKSIEFHGM